MQTCRDVMAVRCSVRFLQTLIDSIASLFPQENHKPGNFFVFCPVLPQSCPDPQKTILGVGWCSPYLLSCFLIFFSSQDPLADPTKDAYPSLPYSPFSIHSVSSAVASRLLEIVPTCSPLACNTVTALHPTRSCICAAERQVGRNQNHPDWSHLPFILTHLQ